MRKLLLGAALLGLAACRQAPAPTPTPSPSAMPAPAAAPWAYFDNSGRDDVLSGGTRMIPIHTPKGDFRV